MRRGRLKWVPAVELCHIAQRDEPLVDRPSEHERGRKVSARLPLSHVLAAEGALNVALWVEVKPVDVARNGR
jgi:hypothetical protein